MAKKQDNCKKGGKIKILAAGDIHGDTSLIKKLAYKADNQDVDLVILAGDITSPIKTNNLIKPFKDKNKKVLLLHGNWDSINTIDFLAEKYDAKNIHGYSVKCNNVGIFGAGGVSGMNSTDNELFETLKKGNDFLNKYKDVKKKILVTHMHAKDTKSEFSGFKGSEGIREAIELFKPDLFLHSHIHEAEGIEEKIGKTKAINVGSNGKIIEV